MLFLVIFLVLLVACLVAAFGITLIALLNRVATQERFLNDIENVFADHVDFLGGLLSRRNEFTVDEDIQELYQFVEEIHSLSIGFITNAKSDIKEEEK